MCHQSPTAQLFAAVISLLGTCLIFWHLYKYDGFRCLLPTRKDAFRCVIVWLLVSSCILFNVGDWVSAYVKYEEYYIYLPKTGVIVKPYQLWEKAHITLFHISYYCLTAAWCFLLGVHLEEFLFWTWLLQVIRSKQSKSWFKSVYFKLWCCGVIGGVCLLFGAATMELESLTTIETNIFFAGSIASLLLTFGSAWVCFKFPAFIRESRRQGANGEVIGKLNYFRQMNNARTAFRLIYTIVLLILSADGLTEHKTINHHDFWVDAFYSVAIFCIFTSTLLSLFVLLPRGGGNHEALGVAKNNVYVRAPNPESYHGISASRGSPSDAESLPSYRAPNNDHDPWGVLGDRLHLEKEDVQELAAQHNQSDIGLPFARRNHFNGGTPSIRGDFEAVDRPDFDTPRHQRVVQNFRSPLDFQNMDLPPDLRVVMNTVTVEKQD